MIFHDKNKLNGAKHHRDTLNADMLNQYLAETQGDATQGPTQGTPMRAPKPNKSDANQRDYRQTGYGRRATRHISWKYGPHVRFNMLQIHQRKEGNVAELRIRGHVKKQYSYVPSVFHVEDDIKSLGIKPIR